MPRDELIKDLFSERMTDAILEKPLKWIQIVQSREGENMFDVEAIRKDGFYLVLYSFDRELDGAMDIWREFKRHYLTLNKIKFGALCPYDANRLQDYE